MKHPYTTQSALPDSGRRNRTVAVIGTILAALLVIELALQFALRTGWRTYRGLDDVSAIAVDRHRQAWAVGYRQSRESLMTFTENGSRVEVPLPAELTNAHPIALMVDRQDRVWVGTDFGVIGMRNVDATWILFSPEEYGSDSTRQIIMDGQGRVWARSHRGPAELDPGSGERTIRYTDSGMPNSDAVALATDPQGQLWALTMKRELKVLEADGNWRRVVVVPGTVRNGFMDASLAFDPQGQIWLTTAQGVGVWSPDGAWQEHPLGDPYRPLSMRGVLTDAEGRVWVATWEQGVFLFDQETGWTNYTARNSGLRSDVNALALDPEGRVWIGSAQGRVSEFDPGTSLPVNVLPAVRFGTQALLPGILVGMVLLAVVFTLQSRPGAGNTGQIIDFFLGFVAWFAVGILAWGFLKYSHEPSSPLMFFNPLTVLVPVVHLVLMIFLFARERRMARGAVLAMVVNSVGMLFMMPLGVAWLGTSLFADLFMMPFFLLF